MAANSSLLSHIDLQLEAARDLSQLPKLLAQENPIDWACFALLAYTVYWVTDGFGRWSKPSPLLFIPVKDRSAFDKIPKKSKNVCDALKVRSSHSLFST
jgi:hypothetical protein